ncbi:MAG: hypothetical protein J0G28_12070 [Afipia sp.]|nr:hypothetical protein [Afipia sp.]
MALVLGGMTGAAILTLALQHFFAPDKAMFDPLAFICSTDSRPQTISK